MKNKKLFEFLCALTEIPTVSGFEAENIESVAKLCMDFTLGFFDEYEILPSGSILFKKKGALKNPKKLMLDAHIDTVGFIVSEICSGGFVKVTNIGGIDPYILPATPVNILGKEKVYGVFTSVPPHLAGKSTKDKLKISDLYVDTGLSEEDVRKLIDIGTPVCFEQKPKELLNNMVASPYLDDKACCASIMLGCRKLAKENVVPDCDLYVHFSVGEEKTQLGAKTVPYTVDVDACIVLDVNFAYTEGVKEYESLVLGKGAGISYSASIKRELSDFIAQTAKKHSLALQSVVEMRSTGTNASYIHRNGIPCAVLSLPLKNMHTFSETVSLDDIEHCAWLLSCIISDFDLCEAVTKTVIK